MNAGEVGSHAVYPLASKVERMPPEGMLTYDMMWGGGEKKAIEFTDED